MRYELILILVFTVSNVVAQTPFEGKISYLVSSPRDKQDATLLAFFGKNKFRIELHDTNNLHEPDYAIINLDSEKVYSVSPSTKTFRVISLEKVSPRNSEIISQIAGQKTTTILPTTQGINFFGGVLPSATIYIGDSLYFPVQDQFVGNQFLSIIQKGRIVLGVKVDLTAQYAADSNESLEASQTNISVLADSISPQQLSAVLFTIPPAFSEFKFTKSKQTFGDSASANFDTGTSMQTKPTILKKKSSPKKKPTTTKSPLHRKEQ